MKLRSFLQAEGTHAENLFYLFAMGVTLGLWIGTIYDPIWTRRAGATLVFYAAGVVLMCSFKLIVMRIMMAVAEER